MAATFTVKPVRHVGSLARYTGLPKISQNTPVYVNGDTGYNSRESRRASNTSSVASTPTWIAQSHISSLDIAMISGTTSVASVYTVDPSVVDWTNVTRTHQRPRNPNGGIPRYTKNIGTARLIDNLYEPAPFPVIKSQTVSEDRQLLLSELNVWTEARKLPPSTPVSLTTPSATNFYSTGTLGHVEDNSVLVSGFAFRWLGGDIRISIFTPIVAPSQVCTVYVVPIDSVTLLSNLASRAALGTVTTIPNTVQSTTFSAATILGAGVVRWDQFWLFATAIGGSDPACVASYGLYSPIDIPPPYDCPGVDCFLPGGFIP